MSLLWMHKTTDEEQGPIETCNSGAYHVVLHAQKDRWGLRHMETSNSDANHAVLHAKITKEGWEP